MQIQQTFIHLENIRLYAYHGVNPQEQRVGAFFEVSLQIGTDFRKAIESDDLSLTVSYADVYDKVKEEMGKPSHLLEHVAGRIAKRLYDEFPGIGSITLRINKENPPMGGQCGSCGVELVTRRD